MAGELQDAFADDLVSCLKGLVGASFKVVAVRESNTERIVERWARATRTPPSSSSTTRSTRPATSSSRTGSPPGASSGSRGGRSSGSGAPARALATTSIAVRRTPLAGHDPALGPRHARPDGGDAVADRLVRLRRLPRDRRRRGAALLRHVRGDRPGAGCRAVIPEALGRLVEAGSPTRVDQPETAPRQDAVALRGGALREGGRPLRSLLILRDGHQCGDEPRGISEGVESAPGSRHPRDGRRLEVVDVHKRSVKNLRQWTPRGRSVTNVLEGQAVYLDGRSALLCCTGAATLGANVTAEPCLLVARDGADVRRAPGPSSPCLSSITSNPQMSRRLAQPLWESDARLQQRSAQDMRNIR